MTNEELENLVARRERHDLELSETEITLAAYLLFAKDPQRKFSQAIIHAGAFKANGAVIIDSRDMQGRIQNQIDETVSFIQKNIHCALVVPPGRIDHVPVWDYPIEAVRETVTNAVCHRDYGSPHDIQIKILDNDLVISSPGELPFDMSLETLMAPNHSSNPRNKLIAKVFFDMGIIEHYGMGITKIKEECAKNDNQCPKWDSSHDRFTTIYKRLGAETKHTNHKTDLAVQNLTPLQCQIILFLRQNPSASRRQIVEEIPNTTEDIIKYNLKLLQKLDLIKHVGPDFGGKWEVQIE